MNDGVAFVISGSESSAEDRLRHIAIQSAAIMRRGWFEEEEPSAEAAQKMIEAVMKGLLGGRITPAI